MLELLNLGLYVHLVLILKCLTLEALVLVDPLEMVAHKANSLDVLPVLLHLSGVGEQGHVLVVEERQRKLRGRCPKIYDMRQLLELVTVGSLIVVRLSTFYCIFGHKVAQVVSEP